MTSACAAFMGTATALAPLLLTWRCWSCRRIVAKLEYDGRTLIEIRHGCNAMNRLPDHADQWLRREELRR